MIRFSLAFALIASPALAEPNCAPRDIVLSHLADRFGEGRRAVGLAGPDRVMELFASEETGTWTVTVTLPNGVTCLVVAGEAFEALEEAASPVGVDG